MPTASNRKLHMQRWRVGWGKHKAAHICRCTSRSWWYYKVAYSACQNKEALRAVKRIAAYIAIVTRTYQYYQHNSAWRNMRQRFSPFSCLKKTIQNTSYGSCHGDLCFTCQQQMAHTWHSYEWPPFCCWNLRSAFSTAVRYSHLYRQFQVSEVNIVRGKLFPVL